MSCTPDLFADDPRELPEGVVLLRQRTSLKRELPAIQALAEISPFRRLQVPGGGYMSVETTNAGAVGWCADRAGYRYLPRDPLTERPWPSCPPAWLECAARWAADAGFAGFEPDCCLINRYDPGARMGAHRDHDERDFSQPIVSVSLGLPATFVWYGPSRTGRGHPIPLSDGDVLVFGGPARLGYHAVRPVRAADARFAHRINLTFRRAR